MRLGEALVKLGFAEETPIARALAKQQGMPFVDLEKGRIGEAVLAKVPAELAQEQGLLPLTEKGGKLVVAIDDPFKRILADQLSFLIGGEVTCAIAAPTALKRAIERYYGAGSEDTIAASMGSKAGDEDGDAPIVRLVTRTFKDALTQRASDIHIEPGHGRVRIRFRVDGMLRDIAEHPEHLHSALVSRLKIMASMDIAEKRRPQDGRIALRLEGREVDVRVSILPSNHGETIVMRLLDKSANLIGLAELGFDPEDYAWFKRVIRRPHGIVLVTGPTGSGKTTTLYAALAELNRPDVKIITAEDPVEYHIGGINQVQVSQRVGLSFSRILKAMLRCAPNVILVGEIRDLETAEIAIQASLTGHLVFSTVHTNDAPSALTRLQDLGVKPFLVSASVHAIVAQRLVRRLCMECAEEYEPHAEEVRALDLDPTHLSGQRFKRPRGCRRCEGSGYRGRVALYELLEMSAELRQMAFQGDSVDKIRATAISMGRLRPLKRDGARKVVAGVTSATEVMRVAGVDSTVAASL
ncbi:MAG: type II/IV secretion system protein [Planctomycetes bacterium]|nr:type II/IV secretion system protein [Planctomycetota bacterium]MCB9905402.1 type II/IV secretion system protein [Planctomycetota bacterium]